MGGVRGGLVEEGGARERCDQGADGGEGFSDGAGAGAGAGARDGEGGTIWASGTEGCFEGHGRC